MRRLAWIGAVFVLGALVSVGCRPSVTPPIVPPGTTASKTPGSNTTVVPKENATPGNPGGETEVKPPQEHPPAFPKGGKLTLSGKEPAPSDVLMLTYPNDPDTLNLLTANDSVSTAFQRWVYESMAEQDYADPDKWHPSLATSWDEHEDHLGWTVHLRKGVMWHPVKLPDGKELPAKEFTARDVMFTFDCILNPNVEAASLRSYYENPKAKDESDKYKISYKMLDKYTIEFRWTEPYFMAFEFTLGTAVLPRHVYSVDESGKPISFDFSSKEFADGFNTHWANRAMCGTGPMMFKEWNRNNRLVLVRNPDYWGSPFYFSEVTFHCIPNNNTVLQEVLQNKLDWAGIQKDHYIQNQDHPNVKNGKVELKVFDSPGYRYIGYNLRKPFLSDKKVRWALSHAIPIDRIIKEVFKGLATPTSGPFQLGSTAYDKSIPPVPFDLEEAKKLLEEAGWTDSDKDGIRDKMIEGELVKASYELMIYADAPEYLTVAQIIQENCRKAGVEVVIEPAKWALMLQNLRKKDYDAAMLGWSVGWKQDPFQIWHGSMADVPDSSNSIGYHNEEVDKLIEELRVTLDPDKQTEIYHKIHRLIYDDQPYSFLFVDKATAGLDSRIQNVNFYKIRPGYDVREWFSSRPRTLGN